MKEEEVVEEGFEDLLYTKEKKDIKKKRKVTKKIGRKYVHNTSKQKTKVSKKDMDISDEGADTLDTSSKKQNDSKKKKTVIWNKPKRIPTKLELRKMFGKALEGMLIVCMNNHVYQFENITRLQKQGGPIGLRLTGEIADCLMINWDKKLLTKLESHGMIPELYTRFKDDIAIVIESLEKGSKLVEDTITVDEMKKLEDENKNDTKVTMDIVQNLANTINPMIKLTVETPCNYPDGKLPVLDITVKINQEAQNRLDFEFFEKPTKNPRVVMADSALSFRQKRTILTQEGLRRLRNTKIELGPEVQKKHLDKFMLKVKNSGYNTKFRTEILDSILKAFEKMVDDDLKNIKPLYRSKNWNAEERAILKSKKKLNWWNTDKSQTKYTSVLFVTPTPGGVLAKALQKREEELNKNNKERIKIVEKGGLKIKDILG